MAAVWPMMPCYNNLVLFDPLKKEENESTIIGELAEKWEWQDGGEFMAFHLRNGVKWHDGQPFSPRMSSTPSTSCARRRRAPSFGSIRGSSGTRT